MEHTDEFDDIMAMYDKVMAAPSRPMRPMISYPLAVSSANYLAAKIKEAEWWGRIGTFGQAQS